MNGLSCSNVYDINVPYFDWLFDLLTITDQIISVFLFLFCSIILFGSYLYVFSFWFLLLLRYSFLYIHLSFHSTYAYLSRTSSCAFFLISHGNFTYRLLLIILLLFFYPYYNIDNNHCHHWDVIHFVRI